MHNDPEGERTLNFHLSARSSFQELAVRAATPGEEERWWSITGRPIHDGFNNFVGFRGSGTDLTEKQRSQEDATRLAHYNSLTSLANRFQMSQTLEKILNAQRIDQRACAVLLLDLDRFKQVNDTMGHPAGDALLTQVAQRLERTVDKAGRVGRLGGDEFQVIIPGRIAPRRTGASWRSGSSKTCRTPIRSTGMSVVIGVSIGIAMSPDDGVTSEALIRNADLALYAAKDGGRGRHHFYAPTCTAMPKSAASWNRTCAMRWPTAGWNCTISRWFTPRPRRSPASRRCCAGTIRCAGALSPAKFIPIAEDAGLIAPIGEWALRTACQDLASWPNSVRVAVNVSPLQFANPALPAIVTNALAAAQVEPRRGSNWKSPKACSSTTMPAPMRCSPRSSGSACGLALDDFGTGYSSLGYLKKAPFDKIKIDQSFVRGATMQGSRNGAIIASIVSLAEALGMETTAEGVETLDELDLVRMLGCSHIQGYIYDKPLTSGIGDGAAAIRPDRHRPGPARGPLAPPDDAAQGCARTPAARCYHGTIRNISATGALIEGLWNVPAGHVFQCRRWQKARHRRDVALVHRKTAWASNLPSSLQLDESGRAILTPQRAVRKPGEGILLRKAG